MLLLRGVRLLILCLLGSTAFADPIDLDADQGTARLAEAAGACATTEPAFIQQACRSKAAPARDFVKRYRSVSPVSVATSLVRLTLPVAELGKEYLFAITEPTIHCDASAACTSQPRSSSSTPTSTRRRSPKLASRFGPTRCGESANGGRRN